MEVCDSLVSGLEECTLPASVPLLNHIHNSVIGKYARFVSPFENASGSCTKQITYCDYTASGRCLKFIEDYIQEEVLPLYGNTHSANAITGLQSSYYRAEARQIVMSNVNGSSDDVVLFAGSGTTSAVALLIRILNFPARGKGVVFVSHMEHHSNILPWREIDNVQVVAIPSDQSGAIDLDVLESQLKKYFDSDFLIGAFCAASNVTGVINNVDAITCLLHRYKAFAFFDYATAAPYVSIDMNPNPLDKDLFSKDAIYFSTHKFIGGPDTPGVLVAKKSLFRNAIPNTVGGGTVFFVSPEAVHYLESIEEREEGGTPSILGIVKTGLVFQLKQRVTSQVIVSRDDFLAKYGFSRLKTVISILGPTIHRLPIFSFVIPVLYTSNYVSKSYLLHPGYITALLNDLFGLQTRSGCACAGPYAHKLLGISQQLSDALRSELYKKKEVLRPGFSRFNLPYFFTANDFEFIFRCIEWVALNGWKLLPLYSYTVSTGDWKAVKYIKPRKWLSSQVYNFDDKVSTAVSSSQDDRWSYFESANLLLESSLKSYSRLELVDELDKDAENIRWFLFPSEALHAAQGKDAVVPMASLTPFVDISKKLNDLNESISTKSASLSEIEYKEEPETADSTLLQTLIDTELSQKASRATKSSVVTDQNLSGKLSKELFVKPNEHVSIVTVLSKAEYKDKLQQEICDNCFHVHHGEIGKYTECITCPCITFVLSTRVQNKLSFAPLSTKELNLLQRKFSASVTTALKQFNMILPGDRVLVAVSGGKDSLSLLHILLHIQKRAPFRFEIGAATVDPQTPEYNPKPLIEYMAANGIPYFYLSQNIIELAKTCMDAKRVSVCSFCSRMKRGCLYSCCRKQNYNVLAMGQHLDDLAESMLMSAFHNGSLQTMKSNYHVAKGDIRVIRPLVLTRERVTREYAKVFKLPIINENCPACFQQPKERARMKSLLATQENVYPSLFSNLKNAMIPLMSRENNIYVEAANKGNVDSNVAEDDEDD